MRSTALRTNTRCAATQIRLRCAKEQPSSGTNHRGQHIDEALLRVVGLTSGHVFGQQREATLARQPPFDQRALALAQGDARAPLLLACVQAPPRLPLAGGSPRVLAQNQSISNRPVRKRAPSVAHTHRSESGLDSGEIAHVRRCRPEMLLEPNHYRVDLIRPSEKGGSLAGTCA